MTTKTYLDPSDASVLALLQRGIDGPVTMLNLLRLREIADYAATPELEPSSPISGRQAYDRYVEHTRPFLEASGGAMLYLGRGGDYLIGPVGEGWDLVMLIRQRSVESFLEFAGDTDYLAGLGHRAAALRDSRILPLEDEPIG